MLISGPRKVSDFFSLFSNFYSLQLWIFFLQKQPIRAARKEGVIFFSLSLQTITKIMQKKEKNKQHWKLHV